MSRPTRMFEIIQLLRTAKTPVTAEEIGNALEVSKRTAYRDIAALQSMRIPIDGEAGIGYIMRPGFDLPPLAFDSDEVEAIVVGLALLTRTGDSGLQRAAKRVASKIGDSLPDQADSNFANDALHVSSWNSIPETTINISLLRHAIRDEEKLSLSYSNAKKQSTERIILPLAIIYYIDVIVLTAWCELREDFRHFRVDRLSKCDLTGRFFSGEGNQLRDSWSRQHSLPFD